MPYTLLMGNNFISNSPKKIKFFDALLFAFTEKIGGDDGTLPLISASVRNSSNKTVVEVNENKCTFCDARLLRKRDAPDHVLITEESGEIVFEFRLLDKKTFLVSGTFYVEDQKLVITQNYIIPPSGKWIMHDRIDSKSRNIEITNEGITVSG